MMMTANLCHFFNPASRIEFKDPISISDPLGIRSQLPKKRCMIGRPIYILTKTVIKVDINNARAILISILIIIGMIEPAIDHTINCKGVTVNIVIFHRDGGRPN